MIRAGRSRIQGVHPPPLRSLYETILAVRQLWEQAFGGHLVTAGKDVAADGTVTLDISQPYRRHFMLMGG